MFSRHTLLPDYAFGALISPFGLFVSLRMSVSRVEEGIVEGHFLFSHFSRDCPLFGTDESSFEQFGVQRVELVYEDLIDLGAFPSGVEVLERLIDVPLESEWGGVYLIMK